jgi:hypothetical protein
VTRESESGLQQVVSKFPGTEGAKQRKNVLMLWDDYGMTRNRVISGLVA